MARLVLEIGTEEIPARFLALEEEAVISMLTRDLEDAALEHGSVTAISTPRRLAVIVEGLADRQIEKEEVISGPPVSAAYDVNGEPTRALLGFMAGQHVSMEQVFRLHTSKGEYVAARKKSGGQPAADVLTIILPSLIARLPFAKRMRWGTGKFAYARPIRWILALLDDRLLDFEIGGIRSGRETVGHRVHGAGPCRLEHAAEYEKKLEEDCHVVGNRNVRKDIIRQKGEELARNIGGKILWNESLLDEVAGLVEMPVPILGDFDSAYLEVPPEALLSSMEGHQKSFGIVDAQGKLLPHFLTVLNIKPVNMADVKHGWERVLRARLEDARFFWRSDNADNFDNWLKKLDQVIFIGPLGSMGEKSQRIAELCQWLSRLLDLDQTQLAFRAGLLSKADLVSSMVGEFDSLQGIMGGIYAARAGEDQKVADAIKEQYLPAGPETPIPATSLGCILSIADKADTLAGCFGLDKAPTGAADPNGLRRCALGIIRILLERNWNIDVSQIFVKARELYGERRWKLDEPAATAKLMEFFRNRMRHYFIAQGYETNMIDAVLGSCCHSPADARARLDAIKAFSQKPDFMEAVQLLKRVENICKKTEEKCMTYQSDLLMENAEKILAARLEVMGPCIDSAIAARKYEDALAALDELKNPVDSFFEQVMVMCENKDLRRNRIGLLNCLLGKFAPIANFSSLQI